MMKTRLMALGAGILLALGVASPAMASTEKPKQFMTVVWQMPSWDVQQNTPQASWPQQYVTSVVTDEPDLDALDEGLATCSYFQVDVYRYTKYADVSNVDNLIAGGVLNGPNDPYEEPLVSAKLVNTSNDDCGKTEVIVPALDVTVDCDSATVFVPKVEGVTWLWSSSATGEGTPTELTTDGEKNSIYFILDPGDTHEKWWITVTATADKGYVFADDAKTEFNFGGTVKPCPEPTPTPTPTPSPTPTPPVCDPGFVVVNGECSLPHTGPSDVTKPLIPGGIATVLLGIGTILLSRRFRTSS